uniref:Uncharacterized protein n=1 Tax=Schistosoma japonicum TaxID=6182 RepID=C1LQ73_SCHJA|nr:hypothetical protein [Schistosoma japonicum]CAX76851.1 hypothetical protein [Schistosoma japonicum]
MITISCNVHLIHYLLIALIILIVAFFILGSNCDEILYRERRPMDMLRLG